MKRCCLLLLSMLLMLTLCGCQSRSGEAGTVPLEEICQWIDESYAVTASRKKGKKRKSQE